MRSQPPPLPRAQPPPLPTAARAVSPLLSLEELERFQNLLIFARTTVEGAFAGRHRSPLPGASAEFRDYKEYVAGDALDRIDWRAYGRTRRLFVRRYEDETDMAATLLVDASASMRYAGERRQQKYQHAARLAASLAYLLLRQGDKAALGIFGLQLTKWIPPGGTRRHLHELLTALEQTAPTSTTGLARALEQAAAVCRKRGRLVVLSDFLTDHTALFDALARFQHRGFSILLLQVLDPDELDLPGGHAARYQDMETLEVVEVDADDLREHFRRRAQDAVADLARGAAAHGCEYRLVNTAEPYRVALEACLELNRRSRGAP